MVELAQLAEHQIVVLRVMGSSPIFHPIHFWIEVKFTLNLISVLKVHHFQVVVENEWRAILRSISNFLVDILKHLFIIDASILYFWIFVSFFLINKDIKMCRGVAQLVAYSLWERGVVSSSLAAPTIKFFVAIYLRSRTIKIKEHHLRVMLFFIILFILARQILD